MRTTILLLLSMTVLYGCKQHEPKVMTGASLTNEVSTAVVSPLSVDAIEERVDSWLGKQVRVTKEAIGFKEPTQLGRSVDSDGIGRLKNAGQIKFFRGTEDFSVVETSQHPSSSSLICRLSNGFWIDESAIADVSKFSKHFLVGKVIEFRHSSYGYKNASDAFEYADSTKSPEEVLRFSNLEIQGLKDGRMRQYLETETARVLDVRPFYRGTVEKDIYKLEGDYWLVDTEAVKLLQ